MFNIETGHIDNLKADEFLTYLKKCLKRKLPGRSAHSQMAPESRIIPEAEVYENNKPRESSVLIPLYYSAGQWQVSFIKRPEYDGVHSGQISFPGGGTEKQDHSVEDTALREAYEEVNIQRETVYIVGRISPLYIPPSNYIVWPVVGLLSERPDYIPQPSEVDKIIEVPLVEFLKPENRIVQDFPSGPRSSIKAPCYSMAGNIIWGATAMIMNEFLTLLKT